jgi:hypothetical protein
VAAEFTVQQVGGKKSPLDSFLMRVRTVAQKAELDIGIHKEDAERSFEVESSGAISRVTNTQLAVWHEFGTENLPARPFLRPVFYQNNATYQELAARLFKQYLDGKIDSPEMVLTMVGRRIVTDLQRNFIRNITPPASPATVASKRERGLPRPHVVLYATGGLYNSIKAKLKSNNVERTVSG